MKNRDDGIVAIVLLGGPEQGARPAPADIEAERAQAAPSVGYTPSYAAGWEAVFGRGPRGQA